jgi:hypothetical protein
MKQYLTLVLFCLFFLSSVALRAQFGVRYTCNEATQQEVELSFFDNFNGKPRYAVVSPGRTVVIQWQLDSGGAWVVLINGNPVGFNPADTPEPPLSSYNGLNQCASDPPQVFSTAVLPVDWVSFSGRALPGSGVRLDWSTINERDNLGFHVERFTDGDWSRIGFVAAVSTERAATFEYTFLDEAPIIGSSTYRIAQEDYDGTISYSKMILIEFDAAIQSLKVYPNPAPDRLRLSGIDPEAEASVEIVDALGRVVRTARPYSPGQYIDLTDLPARVYYITYRTATQRRSIQFLKTR